MAKHSRKGKKGGYLSWNPLNWFKAAPETPVTDESTTGTTSTTPAVPETPVTDESTTTTPTTTSKFNFGSTPSTGARRTRRGGRRHGSKKTRSGKKSNRH